MATPYENAAAAHEGKLKPTDLTAAAKYLYKNLSREELAPYLGGKEPTPPKKSGSLYPQKIRKATTL